MKRIYTYPEKEIYCQEGILEDEEFDVQAIIDENNKGYIEDISYRCKNYNHLKSCIEILTKDKDNISNKIKELKEKLDELSNDLQVTMLVMNMNKIDTPYGTVSLVNTVDKVVVDVDEENLPTDFIKETLQKKVDAKALRKYLNENGNQPFAHLESQKTIRIK